MRLAFRTTVAVTPAAVDARGTTWGRSPRLGSSHPGPHAPTCGTHPETYSRIQTRPPRRPCLRLRVGSGDGTRGWEGLALHQARFRGLVTASGGSSGGREASFGRSWGSLTSPTWGRSPQLALLTPLPHAPTWGRSPRLELRKSPAPCEPRGGGSLGLPIDPHHGNPPTHTRTTHTLPSLGAHRGQVSFGARAAVSVPRWGA